MNLFICRWLRRVLVLSAVVLPGLGATPLRADGLKSAQVSRLYNDVKLLPENQQARPAAVADVVTGKAAVQTGTGSRAELVFTDKTLTRLGANTFFSFENGTRNLDLGNGTMLLQVPKNAGGAEIHTAAVTAAITGTTLMVEYNPKSYSKIIVLEGTVRAYLKGRIGESVLIHAGEMLITPPDAKRLPDSVHVDLSVLYSTSGLLNDQLFGALPSDRLVSNEINHQKGDVAKGKLHGSNLFIAGLGTQVQVGNLAYVGATNTRITAQQGQNSAINLDHPGAGSPTPRIPPVSPTPPPVSPTPPPVSPTPPPVSPTVPPVSPTPPPVSPTVPPVSPTPPPVSPTPPPVSPTPPPVSPTPPPVSPTPPPVSPTPPPVSPTPPPVSPTPPPVSPTPPPVSPTPPPVSPTPPPVSPTPPPVSPTPPPVSPTPPPVSPTPPPVSPTPPPVSPTPPPVSPTPTPGKTGPLSVIAGNDATNPSVYNIDSTTTILTDPYITTQGVTSYGKIYRGSAAGDGAPSSFLLGASTPSAFDTKVGFDTHFDTGTPIGTFLFNSLAITSSPASISTTGGPTSLALIATGGITAAPAPAATIDVSGLTQVLLATQNGPITLSNVTFTDNPAGTPAGTSLTLYARGAANALNVTANLDVSGNVLLFGEGGLNFNQGAQALSANSATLISGADLTLGGIITASGSTTSTLSATATGNLTIATSGALNSTCPLSLTVGGLFQSDGVTNANSSALSITSTGNLTTTSGARLTGGVVTLSSTGALSLGGTTLFSGSLNASSVGNLSVPGAVGGAVAGNTTPQALGTATFTTNGGNLGVTGQVTANTVNFNVAGSGSYSTGPSALITANTVNISAPSSAVSLSTGVYVPASAGNSSVTVTGGDITVSGTAFTPFANQSISLIQPGTFTVPANAAYTFTSLDLTNPDTAANPGNLAVGANSVLNLAQAQVGGDVTISTGGALNSANSLSLTVGGLFQSDGVTSATNTLNITATGALNTTANAQIVGGTLTLSSTAAMSLGGFTLFFKSLNASSVGNLDIPGVVGGVIAGSTTPQVLGTATFTTNDGNLGLTGQITADTVGLTAASGNYTSGPASAITADLVTLSAVNLTLGGGVTASSSAANALSATATGDLTIPGSGVLNTAGTLTLSSGGTFQSAGTIAGVLGVNITSAGSLTATANAQISGGALTLTSGAALALNGSTSFFNSVQASSVGDMNLLGTVAGAAADNPSPQTVGTADFATSTGNLNLSGQITADTVDLNAATGNYTSTAAATVTANRVTISGGILSLGGAITADGNGANALRATASGNLTIPNGSTLNSAGAITLTDGGLFQSDGSTSATHALNITSTGDLNTTANAQLGGGTVTLSGVNLSLGGAITALNSGPSALNATASGNLTLPTGGTLNATGAMTLTSGGTFQSDGSTGTSSNTLTINSTGDLTTTSNAQLSGDTVNLTTSGVLTLGGTTSFTTSLNASSVGALNVPGVVSAEAGTATFGTSTGDVNVGGQITAGTVNFNLSSGNYSTATGALISANAVNISAPAGNVSLSSAAYAPMGESFMTVTATGNTISIPDATFIPSAYQTFNLTQNGTFTVPANAAYTFNSLTLNNPDTAANPGNLVLSANSALTLSFATVGASLSLADGAVFTTESATVAQTVTLTGAPTLNISGVFEVKNTDGAADALTATGAATINLSNPTTTGFYGLFLDTGNFNGGSATINGAANSTVNVDSGSFTTSGSVTTGQFSVFGNVSIGGTLRAASASLESTATVGALSVQNLTDCPTVIVNGDVTPYDRTQLDTLSPVFLEVGGSLNYAGLATPTLATDINGGQLNISLDSQFYLGPGAASATGGSNSYAASANFAGAALSPTTDNLTAGNGGALTISTISASGVGKFAVGDFTYSGLSTAINLQGGNLMSASGNTGFGGHGGTFEVNSGADVDIEPNVTMSAYGGDFDNSAAVTGSGTPAGGNGGTVMLNALSDQSGAVNFSDSTVVDLHGGGVGSGGASGGTAGNGGTLALNASGQIAIGDGTGTPPLFNVQGGVNSQAGTSGNGGSVSLIAGGSIMLESAVQFTADGGLLMGTSGTAGNGGSVTLQAGGVISLGFDTDITPEAIKRPIRVPEGSPGDSSTVFLTADGGTANQAGLVGGNGGTINITSANTDTTQSSIQTSNVLISATTGGNRMTAFGGTGGTINITASNTTAASPDGTPPPAQIDLDNTTVVASDDGTVTSNTPDSHSQVGGTINITSMLPSGPGILVTDNSKLVALVNAGSTGAGGSINLLTAGANIEVDNSTLAASGTGSVVQLNTQQTTSSTSVTSINLNAATLSADSVNLSTAGPSGQINISGGSTLTAVSTLTINSPGITLGDYGETTNQFLASTTSGTINLTSTSGSFNPIELNGATLSANTINIQTTGDSSSMYVDGGSTLTAGSTLTINSANIELGDGGQTTNQLLASNTGGTINLTAATTAGQGIISLNNCTVQADNITFTVSGPGSEIYIENDQSTADTPATFAAQSSLSLYGPEIEIYNATVTSNSTTGSITLDTMDTTQTGTINLDAATLSAAYVTLTARGTGGSVNVFSDSSVTGSNGITLQGTTIFVNSSTLVSNGPGSVFALGGVGGTGSGANIQVGGSTLEANGLFSTLTLTGAPGTGADIQVTSASTLEANGAGNVLTLTTASTTGTGIQVSNGAMLSSTNPNDTNFDGGTINLTTAGAIIDVDASTLTASGTGSAINLTSTGAGANIMVVDGSSLTIGNAGTQGTISLTSTGNAANITVDGSTLMTPSGTGGTISLMSTGTGSTLNVTGGSTVAGDASVSLAGTTITVTGSTVSANGSTGTLTLDTTDPAQDGLVNITTSTLSAGTVSLTAQGTNGAITVGGTGGTGGVQAMVTASSGNLTLQTPGANGSITISPDSTLAANSGTFSLLAPGATGLITVGTSNTSNTDATTLSADMLKMRAMGTNGSIVINANSTLSATTQLLLYADGSNGSITFQGGNITLNTGSMAGILAAPSITIKTGTTVTVNGSTPIQVFTNNANYSDDYGGNDTQVGGFAGNAQPDGTPAPFSSAPAYSAAAHASVLASNAAVPTAPAANTTKGGKVRLAGTSTRPAAMPMQRPSIPFSALNLNDLSYDPRLLQGGPKTPATAARGNKAGTRAPVRDVAAGREKVRAAATRPETGSNKPAAPVLSSMVRLPR